MTISFSDFYEFGYSDNSYKTDTFQFFSPVIQHFPKDSSRYYSLSHLYLGLSHKLNNDSIQRYKVLQYKYIHLVLDIVIVEMYQNVLCYASEKTCGLFVYFCSERQ